MSNLQLEVKKREITGKKVKKMLAEDLVPGVVYGHKIENTNIAISAPVLKKIYAKAGESTLIDLVIGEETPVKVIIQAIQLDVSGDKIIHVDFHQVRMDEKLTTDAGLKFLGDAPAVKLGGVLIINSDTISIECLPQDLVHEIEVDISSLDSFDKGIHVKDINLPEGMRILSDENEVIAVVESPKKEEVKVKKEEAPEEKKEEPAKKEEKK